MSCIFFSAAPRAFRRASVCKHKSVTPHVPKSLIARFVIGPAYKWNVELHPQRQKTAAACVEYAPENTLLCLFWEHALIYSFIFAANHHGCRNANKKLCLLVIQNINTIFFQNLIILNNFNSTGEYFSNYKPD